VEFTGCALFAGAAARLGYNWDLPATLVLLASLLALSFIDIEHLVLPKVIVYPTFGAVAALLALAAGETNHWRTLLISAVCSIIWFAVFFVLNLTSPRLLGFGDVRLALVLGLSLGWFGWRYAVLGFFIANLVGAVVGLALIGLKKMTRDQPIPYGVFLAFGTAFAIFVGPEIVPLAKGIH
jgi:leader peptidase (prepilin peptidase)/N-methyltransferase